MYVHVCVCMCMYVYVCVGMCSYVYVFLCICVYVCSCMHIYLYLRTCVGMCVYVCPCMCMHAGIVKISTPSSAKDLGPERGDVQRKCNPRAQRLIPKAWGEPPVLQIFVLDFRTKPVDGQDS